MNNVDKQYLSLLSDIMNNGVEKDTRAGKVKSVFGRQLRFDLKNGFPLLTTKKVFAKGIIHELLWFLQRPHNSHGSMNIEYLVRNKVYIWNDDAYRWFITWVGDNILKDSDVKYEFVVCLTDDERGEKPVFEWWIENDLRKNDLEWLADMTKDTFIDMVLDKVEIRVDNGNIYRFGDLGAVYGSQWRGFNGSDIDQIQGIIDTLKTNPNDRRMLCVAFNPMVLDKVALPPCHVMFQFYTRELTDAEKDEYGVKYGLSCMYTMRSNDYFLGQPFNTASYSLLTHMIAKLVNMIPDEIVASLGDCHIYEAHLDAVKEQLSRIGYESLPKLEIEGNQTCIEDFKFEDFKIMGYMCDPPIKAPLLVG